MKQAAKRFIVYGSWFVVHGLWVEHLAQKAWQKFKIPSVSCIEDH